MGRPLPISLRTKALTLLEEGVPISRIKERTGLSESAIYKTQKRAKDRVYNSNDNFIFKDEFFVDAKRPGRSTVMDEEKEGKNVIKNVDVIN
jgi:hypothetical protein